MSGSGLVVAGMDRRRSPSIGIEERALSTLEKFVELCDKGMPEEDDVETVLDSLDSQGEVKPKEETIEENPTSIPSPTTPEKSKSTTNLSVVGTTEENGTSRIDRPILKSAGSNGSGINKPTKRFNVVEFKNENKAKLCELFIDPTMLEMKTKATEVTTSQSSGGPSGSSSSSSSATSGTATTTTSSTASAKNTTPPKKSEEIWVRRVESGRRSFRITNFRGQPLPSILTEDVDESDTNPNPPQYNHYHTVTGATPGIRQMLKPIIQAKDDEIGRHKSGEHKSSLFDAFRPRSKSDAGKMKKPNFMSKMNWGSHGSSSGNSSESKDNSSSSSHRPRSGSESLRSPVSKVMDIFRHRSSSVNAQDRKNKQTSTNSWTPQPAGARRASLHSHRPSDVSLDPAHAAILFRDSRGLPAVDPFLERFLSLSDENENEILVKFFKFHKCYDLIPTSAKLVVFDTQLLVKKAFFALVYNGVRAAPLWDSTEEQFVGMLTITDFIRVLHAMYHDSSGRMSELEEHRVQTWRQRFLQNNQRLIFVYPDASLYDAICNLVNNRIHRLPVIDESTGNVLHILTHKRILKFLFLYIHEIPRPSIFNQRLGDVRIGTFDKVETAREDTPIIQALQKILDRRVSALPIVDDQNRLLDIYARFDVINLAAEKTYNNLDITLKQANEHRNEWFEGVHKCTLDESLFIIMERIVKAEVHRLVVVDEQDRVVGVISLSDILQFLVMRPELQEVSMESVQGTVLKDGTTAHRNDDENERHTAVNNHCNNNCSEEDILEGDELETEERENPTIIEEEDEKI